MPRAVDLIVIHCAATKNGGATTVYDIDRMHAQRGFHREPVFQRAFQPSLRAIGYHFFIASDGTTYEGRHLDEVGAHAQGYNTRSVGICLNGTDDFSDEQYTSLASVVSYIKSKYPDAAVTGHRDLSPDIDGDGVVEPHEWLKTCPGFDAAAWWESVDV